MSFNLSNVLGALIGAVLGGLLTLVITSVIGHTDRISRNEAHLDSLLKWQASYEEGPWGSMAGVTQWLGHHGKWRRKVEDRLDSVEAQIGALHRAREEDAR